MEWLTSLLSKQIPAGGWGVAVVLGLLLLWLVLTGRLVPRRTLLDMRADRDAWRAIAGTEGDRADELSRQNGVLTTQLSTLEATLRALPQPPRGGRW